MKHTRFRKLDEHFMKNVEHIFEAGYKLDPGGLDRFSEFRKASLLADTEMIDEMAARMRRHVIAFFRVLEGGRASQQLQEHGSGIINYVRLINGALQEGDIYYEEETCNHPECASSSCCQVEQGTASNTTEAADRGGTGRS